MFSCKKILFVHQIHLNIVINSLHFYDSSGINICHSNSTKDDPKVLIFTL